MSMSFEAFCIAAKQALRDGAGRAGREQVRCLLENLLASEDFLRSQVEGEAESGQRTIYRDADLGFVVLVHVDNERRDSPPHDHGSSWAIYGQTHGFSVMGEWSRVDGGTDAGRAELRLDRSYRLEPGKAGLFDVGAIHSVERSPGCRYVRVTGTELEHVRRLKFDPEHGRAVAIESARVS